MAEFTLPNAEQFERLIEEFQRLNGGDTSKPIDDLHNGPGPKHLISGNRDAGFYGFVKPSEFGMIDDLESTHKLMNGDNLALAIGLSVGETMNTNVPWMKFSFKEKTIYIPVRPLRNYVAWRHIYQSGAVYGTNEEISSGEQFMLANDDRYNGITNSLPRVSQTAAVVIDQRHYAVRLPKGANSDPLDSYEDSDRGVIGSESEWNNLILPLHENAPYNFLNNQYVGDVIDNWGVDLTDEDLQVSLYELGMYSWCQETRDSLAEDDIGNQRRLVRGGYRVENVHASVSSNTYRNVGWRPVLEIK